MLTIRQKELWDLIAASNENDVILSLREISDALGWKSSQTARNHISKLESMRYVFRPPGRPREILAVTPDFHPHELELKLERKIDDAFAYVAHYEGILETGRIVSELVSTRTLRINKRMLPEHLLPKIDNENNLFSVTMNDDHLHHAECRLGHFKSMLPYDYAWDYTGIRKGDTLIFTPDIGEPQRGIYLLDAGKNRLVIRFVDWACGLFCIWNPGKRLSSHRKPHTIKLLGRVVAVYGNRTPDDKVKPEE